MFVGVEGCSWWGEGSGLVNLCENERLMGWRLQLFVGQSFIESIDSHWKRGFTPPVIGFCRLRSNWVNRTGRPTDRPATTWMIKVVVSWSSPPMWVLEVWVSVRE